MRIPLERFEGVVGAPVGVYRPLGIGALQNIPAFMLGIAHLVVDMESLRGLDAHKTAETDLKARLKELDDEAAGQPFNDDQRAEFEEISEPETGQLARVQAAIDELEIRDRVVKSALAEGGRKIEAGNAYSPPNVIRIPDDVHDLAAYRQRAHSLDDLPNLYRDGAMRVIEKASFPTTSKPDEARAHVAELIERHKDDDHGAVSRRIVGTTSPAYAEGWGRYMAGGLQAVPNRLQAALQTYTDAEGGFAIPITIDPTFVLTTDGQVNEIREISRVETITTKTWSPVTTGGVVAAYAAETAAAADAAPTDVAAPVITPNRAHVLVGFTAEYNEDYGPAAIQSEVGKLIRDAKNVLEATKFILGSGTAEPDGIVARIITAAGVNIIPSATVATFALVDVDALEGALGDRFIGNARFLAPRKIYQLARAFGTAGQPAGSIYDPMSKTLRGYPASISNTMDKTTTTASEPLLFGDFNYFVIVDRLGLSTEFIPQLFNASGNPLGRRGIYARWRNDTGVLAQNAFRLLRIA